MADRKKIERMLKDVIKASREILLEMKKDPDLFRKDKPDTVVARTRRDAQLYVEAQRVMKYWETNWIKEYNTRPHVDKKHMYMIANLLKRLSYDDLINALDNYFDKDDEYLSEKIRYDLGYFIGNVNRYLVENTGAVSK